MNLLLECIIIGIYSICLCKFFIFLKYRTLNNNEISYKYYIITFIISMILHYLIVIYNFTDLYCKKI